MVSDACKNFHFFVGFSLPLPTALPVGNAFLSFPGGCLPGISVCSLLAAVTSQRLLSYTMNFKQTLMLVQSSPSCCCMWLLGFLLGELPKELWWSPVWRGQAVRRVSLAWRSSFIVPKGLLVRHHCWGMPERKIFLTVPIIWKHFRDLSKLSWNIPVVCVESLPAPWASSEFRIYVGVHV